MTVMSKLENNGKDVTIHITGRFDFGTHKEFRDAYVKAPASANFIVDLLGTDYMDSSALGMLLLLRAHAGGDKSRVHISGGNSDIQKILALSNFQQLFDIK